MRTPTSTATATPGRPSAFITTADHRPPRLGQTSVWVPRPATAADQKCWLAGRSGARWPVTVSVVTEPDPDPSPVTRAWATPASQ